MQHDDFQHRGQDSRMSLGEQILQQFQRQSEAERQLEQEQARHQGTLSERSQ